MISILLLMASLEFGMTQGSLLQYRPYFVNQEVPPCYATFEGSAEYKGFFLTGSVRTDMLMKEISNWYPIQSTYMIGGGFRNKRITIGFEHACFHPMMPYATMMPRDMQAVPKWEGAYDRVYVRITLSNKEER